MKLSLMISPETEKKLTVSRECLPDVLTCSHKREDRPRGPQGCHPVLRAWILFEPEMREGTRWASSLFTLTKQTFRLSLLTTFI